MSIQGKLGNIIRLSTLRSCIQAETCNTLEMNQISEYEKLWTLIKKYPELKFVPSKEIDQVWHFHLAQKQLYHADCLLNFGYVVGHKEARSKEDSDRNKINYLITNQLWLNNYGYYLGSESDMALCGVGDSGVGDDGDSNDTGDQNGDISGDE